MLQPKISILIPVFNAESFLRQCIESVLSQPMKEIELVCVNDGSTDNSARILDEYAKKDSRIRIVTQQNSGPGVALNKGLEVATGEFVHFLDSDDFLTENAYEKTCSIANKYNLDYLKVKAYPIDAFNNMPIGGSIADKYALGTMSPEDYVTPFSFAESPEKFTKAPVFAPWSGIYRRSYLVDNNIKFSAIYAFADHSFYFAAASRAKRVLAADLFILYHRMNNSNSLVGSYAKRFGNHFESFRFIKDGCKFLQKKLYSQILNCELESIFSWYHKISSANITHATKLMLDFIRALDTTELDDASKNSLWYLEYLMMLKNLSNGEKSSGDCGNDDFIREIKNRIPLPVDVVRPESKVILYGAGNFGQRIYRLFVSTRFCEVLKLVDKNWKALRSDKLPVFSPDEIKNSEYDYILLTAENSKSAHNISTGLKQSGICESKILC